MLSYKLWQSAQNVSLLWPWKKILAGQMFWNTGYFTLLVVVPASLESIWFVAISLQSECKRKRLKMESSCHILSCRPNFPLVSSSAIASSLSLRHSTSPIVEHFYDIAYCRTLQNIVEHLYDITFCRTFISRLESNLTPTPQMGGTDLSLYLLYLITNHNCITSNSYRT